MWDDDVQKFDPELQTYTQILRHSGCKSVLPDPNGETLYILTANSCMHIDCDGTILRENAGEYLPRKDRIIHWTQDNYKVFYSTPLQNNMSVLTIDLEFLELGQIEDAFNQ